MFVKKILLLMVFHLLKNVVAFDASSNSNVAVYWGQGSGQEDLATYCASDAVDIVMLSFMSSFPDNLSLDFANACSDSFSDGLKHCSQIGKDIKTCQDNGKVVLLSLGGAIGQYGFTSDSQAQTFAKTLWNKFGGGSDDERPFDSAIVDGFDFDFEKKDQTGVAALGTSLRSYFDKDSSKSYYLSAAPQCPYPDESVGDLLSQVEVDFAFIQFYNNYCLLGSSFNWDTWKDYASKTSPNKDIKLYLGLPGSSSAAGSGYVSASTVESTLADIKSGKNFGGISLWDAATAWGNTEGGDNFAEQMKSLLGGSSGSSGSSSSTPTSTKAAAVQAPTSTNNANGNVLTTSVIPSTFKTITTTGTVSHIVTLNQEPGSATTQTYNNGQYDNSKFNNGQWNAN